MLLSCMHRFVFLAVFIASLCLSCGPASELDSSTVDESESIGLSLDQSSGPVTEDPETADEPAHVEVEVVDPRPLEERLREAVEAGDYEMVESLLLNEAFDDKSYWPYSIMGYAVNNGDAELVRLLMRYDSRLSYHRERADETVHPVSEAIRLGNRAVIDAFFEEGLPEIDPSGYGSNHDDYVRVAVEYGEADFLRFLLDRGVDPNHTVQWRLSGDPTSGEIPVLHIAAEANRPEMVQVLLDYGAEIHAMALTLFVGGPVTYVERSTALDEAPSRSQGGAAEYLRSAGGKSMDELIDERYFETLDPDLLPHGATIKDDGGILYESMDLRSDQLASLDGQTRVSIVLTVGGVSRGNSYNVPEWILAVAGGRQGWVHWEDFALERN